MNKKINTYGKVIGLWGNKLACLMSCAIILLIEGPLFGAEDIIIRTSVTPDEVWVGQKAVMYIDVIARNGWAQIKKTRDARINGAYIMSVETQGTRISETIKGDTYTGQRYELLIFPQVDGKIAVPPFPVDIEVKSWGADPVNKISRLSTPGVEFNVRTPPGAEGIRGLISTSALTAEQKWVPDTDPAKVGDAIKRTIVFKAEDVSGMAFTPLEFRKMEGAGVYPGEPDVSDTKYRGTLSGERIEKVTYVFEEPGRFNIQEIVFFWWDIENKELKRIELTGKKIEIAGAAATGERLQKKSEQIWLITLCVIALILGITLIFTRKLRHLLESWKRARSESETAYFRRIIKAARSGNAGATLREIMRWLDRINSGDGIARLDQFINEHGNNMTKKTTAQLMECIKNNDSIPDIPALLKSLKKVRHQWKKSLKKVRQAEKILPELNG